MPLPGIRAKHRISPQNVIEAVSCLSQQLEFVAQLDVAGCSTPQPDLGDSRPVSQIPQMTCLLEVLEERECAIAR